LQDDASLRSGRLLAGPYHPAFGELVAGRQCRDRIEGILAHCPDEGRAVIAVPRHLISQAVGHKKAKLAYFNVKYPRLTVALKAAPVNELSLIEFSGAQRGVLNKCWRG
jgi:hypothetical protein